MSLGSKGAPIDFGRILSGGRKGK